MAYGYLSSAEQWQLHDFFQPTKGWTDQQLLAHRSQITQERPSLPHQAGRALAKIDEIAARVAVFRVRSKHRAAAQAKSASRSNVRNADRQIRVLGVVKPAIEVERLAHVIALMAEHLAAEERTRQDTGGGVMGDDVDHPDLAAS